MKCVALPNSIRHEFTVEGTEVGPLWYLSCGLCHKVEEFYWALQLPPCSSASLSLYSVFFHTWYVLANMFFLWVFLVVVVVLLVLAWFFVCLFVVFFSF